MRELEKCFKELALIHPSRLDMLIYDIERSYICVDRTEREILLDCLNLARTLKRFFEVMQRTDSELTVEEIRKARLFVRTLARKLYAIDEDLASVENGKKS